MTCISYRSVRKDEYIRPVEYIKNLIYQNSISNPVILLEGEMGAGKTSFAREFVKSYDKTLEPNSPTFNLLNEYPIKNSTIYHFDLYRLSGKEEAIEAGFGEILGKSGISIVEWWERAKGIYPQDSILVKFQVEEENSRNLEIFWNENLIF